ncbi:hypothetical protein EV2_038837 [Malus domestica]
MATKIMEWAEGWIYMQQGVTKLTTILEGLPETQFTPEEYMMLYTTIHTLCIQKLLTIIRSSFMKNIGRHWTNTLLQLFCPL